MEMLFEYMYISILMVFSQQIQESKLRKEKSIFRMDKEGFDGHGRSMNRPKFSQKGQCSASKNEDGRVSKPRHNGRMSILDILSLGVA